MNNIIEQDDNNAIKGTTGSRGSKDLLDKFYTKTEIVKQCLQYINFEEYDCIIEPSAGSGAFLYEIPRSKNYEIIAYDLKPEPNNNHNNKKNNTIIQQNDWLKLDKQIFNNYNNILVIGNPPFGKMGSLAQKFIKESTSFAHTVAFILPKGFKKESFKNKIDKHFWLTDEIVLPENSFTLNDNDYSVPCVFQKWVKKDSLRKDKQYYSTSALFEFTTKEKADLRVQRVGGKAGTASINTNASEQSNYFLKNTSNFTTTELVEKINNTSFPTINDTTGPRSLSKKEFIYYFEEKLGIKNHKNEQKPQLF